MDLLFLTPVGVQKGQLVSSLRTQLKSKDEVQTFRIVSDALVPLVHLRVFDLDVDLQFAAVPSAHIHAPLKAPAKVLDSLDSVSRRSLGALLDYDLLLQRVPEPSQAKFRSVLTAVRAWAKLRDISSNGFCTLGGISWSGTTSSPLLRVNFLLSCVANGLLSLVLVSAFFSQMKAESMSSEELVGAFFEYYSTWNWTQSVGLDASTSRPASSTGSGVIQISAPSDHKMNTARNSTLSTTRILQAEFTRAANLVRESKASGTRPWVALLESCVPAKLPHHSFLTLDFSASTQEELDRCSGWLSGHLVTLVLGLESKLLNARPFSTPLPGAGNLVSCRYVIVLNKEPRPEGSAPISFGEDILAFDNLFHSWSEKPQTAALKLTQFKELI